MRIIKNIILCATLLAVSHLAAAHCSVETPAFVTIKQKRGASIQGPLSIDELERTHMIQIRESGEWVPFGYASADWVKFKVAVKPGDEIYFFSYHENRFYNDGHILVRKGCIIRHLLGSIS